MCNSITASNTKCLLAPSQDICHIHAKIRLSKLEKKVADQRVELATFNRRYQELAQKVKIVQRIDYLKTKLRPLCRNRGYRSLITDLQYRREIEAIFNKSFHECIDEYDNLLMIRNEIVHPYQKKTWDLQPYRRMVYNKSLNELAVCVY